jgi:glycosyltransferase involved in cell wall biosynthesis
VIVADNVIGIDASRMVASERTGTETYTANIVTALLNQSDQHRYRLYLNAAGPPSDVAGRAELRLIPFPRGWTHIRLSIEMALASPDLLFVPAHVIPILHPKSIVTIHDLGYLYHPESHPPRQRWMLEKTTRWNARVAHHIIAPSAATANDLRTHLQVPDERISMIHHGVSPDFSPAQPDAIQRVRRDHHLHRPYVLSVGTRQPRKNYVRLAQAHRNLLAEGHEFDLVIAGKPGWLVDEVDRELERAGLGDHLRILDYVPNDDLCPLYSGAEVFVMPSLYEGFGLPLLEAMASGTPTIAAKRSSLVEIAGNAAVLVDPLDVGALSRALVSMVRSKEMRSTLAVEGRAQARQFSWEAAGAKTAELFARLLHTVTLNGP